MANLRFRRQHPVGPFFADFACVERKVVIELDGGYHEERAVEDSTREAFLKSEGWRVIRFRNEDVLEDVDAVARSIARQMGVEPVFKRRVLSKRGGASRSATAKSGRERQRRG